VKKVEKQLAAFLKEFLHETVSELAISLTDSMPVRVLGLMCIYIPG